MKSSIPVPPTLNLLLSKVKLGLIILGVVIALENTALSPVRILMSALSIVACEPVN